MIFPEYLQLLFLGSALLMALLLAQGATKLKAPMVVGYIIAGAILGPQVLNVITHEQVSRMELVNQVVLALIGFGIGGELSFGKLKKLGKSIIVLVVFESMGAFFLVSVFCAIIVKSIPLGLIYGALAAATAPAGTVDVLKQYRAKGEMTNTLYAVMALDDILSLILYALIVPLSVIMLVGSGGSSEVSILGALGEAGLELLLSVVVGIVSGFLLTQFGKMIHNRTTLLSFVLGVVLINCGIAELLHLSPILVNMVAGIVLVNRKRLLAGKIFSSMGDWSPPFYIWFFVLIGTFLDIKLIHGAWWLIGVYIISRSLGKWSGAFFGSWLIKASTTVRKYLGFTLLSQAGVAVGLALSAAKILQDEGFAAESVQLLSTMTATTFLIMLVGPLLVKVALFKAGEATVKE